MKDAHTPSDAIGLLRDAGLRPTTQRIMLARLLFDGEDKHVTAEQLFEWSKRFGQKPLALATIYNTLNQFTDAGLLKEVMVEAGKSYFDTNTSDHHHVHCVMNGTLHDVTLDTRSVKEQLALPDGYDIEQIQVIVRVKPST